MKTENLSLKMAERLAKRKFEEWKKEFIKEINRHLGKYKEEIGYDEKGIYYAGIVDGLKKIKEIIKQKAGLKCV